MARVTDIITRVRKVLSDVSATRYTNDTLMELFNECADNLALGTELLMTMSAVELQAGISRYTVENAIDIKKVQYRRRLTARTEQEMVDINPDWESVTGDTPVHVIFDNLPKNTFKIYPFPAVVGVIETTYNSLYGGVIDINVDNDLLYPVYSELGVGDYLFVAYTKKADKILISTTDEQFEFDEICDNAFVMYISGQALRIDNDALNRQFGAEQISLYGQYVKQYLSKESKNNNTVTNNSVPYQGFQ